VRGGQMEEEEEEEGEGEEKFDLTHRGTLIG
jgi:hypothetical protein